MKQKKVMFLLYSLAVGGAERRAATLANYLVAHGVEMQIVMLDAPRVKFEVDPRVKLVHLCAEKPVLPEDNLAPVELVCCQPPAPMSFAQNCHMKWLALTNKKAYQAQDQYHYFEKMYVSYIREYVTKHPDWMIVSWMTFCNISTMAALQKLPNKAVFVECMSPEAEYPDGHYMNLLKKRFYPRAQKAICQTPDEAGYYGYLPNTEKYVIPNPIRGEYPSRYEGERRKEIVNFCRLSGAKNLPLLMDAFALIAPDYPDYTLSIYGEGELKEELLAYADSLGLSERITIHDFDTHIHDKIRDCAMFVSSSDREGISNSMLEALAIGLPTICTDCPAGGARMLIKQRESGIVIPMRDPQAMASAMREIIDNPAFAEKLSKNAVKIREELTVDAIGEQWMKALDLEEQV